MKTFAQKIDPILIGLHDEFVNQAANPHRTDPKYSKEALIAVIFMFTDVLLSHMYNRQSMQDMGELERYGEAAKCSKEIHELVEKYTGLDTRKFYE